MHEIIIVGTRPPCPRCKLLTNVVKYKAEIMGVKAKIKHIAYTDKEAVAYAEAVGLMPGTAKDVAEKTGVPIDWQQEIKIPQEYFEQIENLEPGLKDQQELFQDVAVLDNRLRAMESIATEVGVMMTPVLIINGEIKYQGSVPWLKDIEEWLAELK